MTDLLAVDYGTFVVEDPTWFTESDVIASYHHSGFTTSDGRITGILVRRVAGEWVPVH